MKETKKGFLYGETNKYGNIINKRVAYEVADSLGLSVVKSQYGGYMLEWKTKDQLKSKY